MKELRLRWEQQFPSAYGFYGLLVHSYQYLNIRWAGPNLHRPRRVTKARAEREFLALHLQCKIALGPMIMHTDSACNVCIQVTGREVL